MSLKTQNHQGALKRGRFDLEADGLLQTATKVHCLAVQVDDGVPTLYVGKEIPNGLAALDDCNVIVAHNGIGFDLMVLWKLYKWKPKAKVEDTLTMSCLIHPDIQGGHSLEAWGERLGEKKTDYKAHYQHEYCVGRKYEEGEEWREYNNVMGNYCLQDVRVLAKLDDYFLKQRTEWDWEAALSMELQFAKDFAVQGWRGVAVDVPFTQELLAKMDREMAEIEQLVEPLLPKKDGTKGQLDDATPPKLQFKKNGEPTAACEKWFDAIQYTEPNDVGGRTLEIKQQYKRPKKGYYGLKYGKWHLLPVPNEPLIKKFPMKLADQQHIKAWLMDMGWKPTMWSFKKKADKNGKLRLERDDKGQLIPTHPKFHDKGQLCPNLEEINSEFEHVAKVVRWVVVRHRRGLVQSILDALRPDGRVAASGFALGTPTSRVTHSVVANIPKAEPEVVYGKECRSMFIAPEGKKFVGVDAASLELRMLAHYVGSPELTKIVVEGTKENGNDIHSVLWKACNPLVPSRTIQKNVTYGWLYGASDKKLGQTAGHPDNKAEKAGTEIRKRMVAAVPGLDKLMKKIEQSAERGYIIAIDGRKIEIRSRHATLNTLLQSAGSILVKNAQCYMNHQIRKQRLNAWQVISYHDEVQLETIPQHAEQAGRLFIEGLQWAGKRYKVRCPLDGEVKVGRSWSETH